MSLNCEIICKCLQSLDRRERQRALNDLLELAASPDANSEEIIRIYNETYLFIIKCYSDKYESCRELATSVVSEFFKHLPRNDYYLQYVISTLSSRIGQKELIEESEELRLLLLIQLDFIIHKFRIEGARKETDLLLKCYDEIVNILVKQLADKYPSAQRAACSCIRTLAEATPSFHYRAESFVNPLLPLLHHKHSMNRVSAIETLGVVSLHITTNSECISQIITEITPLLMDSMPLVRKECGKTGCRLLMELKDRYSFFARILPLVLCCLNDDTPDVRDYIHELWSKCGEKYFEENETELSKKQIVDKPPAQYPNDILRPSLGCRAIVQRNLKIIQLVLRETTDWKEEVRMHSLKLLWQIILHAEIMIGVHVLDIFPVLGRACADPDKIVTKQALKCAELMGMLMAYNEWFSSCLQSLAHNPRLGFLRCFYSMYFPSVANSSRDDIEKLAKLLHERNYSHCLNSDFQEYLLKFVDIMISATKCQATITDTMENLSIADIDEKTDEYLYHITIKVIAISYDYQNENVIMQLGQEMLLKLAHNEPNEIFKLHAIHLKSVLATFDCLDARNDGNSEAILLLHGVICVCGFHNSYVKQLKELISLAFEYASSDGKVKILSGISIAMMSWNQTIGVSSEESFMLLQNFINDIILPFLMWKPGVSAEGLRSLATSTLCSMAQGAPQEASALLSELSEILPGLVEDNSATTRVYALRSLSNIGPIKLDNLRKLGYAVIQRLDDPSSEVRDWSARVITKIHAVESIDESSKASVQNYFVDILSTLFLHFEGPEIKLQTTIKSSIITLGKMYRVAFMDAYGKAFAMASNNLKEELLEIKMLVEM